MSDHPDSVECFRKNGFTVSEGLLSAELCDMAYRYLLLKTATNQFRASEGDSQVAGAPAEYADPLMEVLLASAKVSIERATGLALLPTYSYCRVYARNATLRKHRDRAECEISATICLGYEGPEPSPLFVEGPQSAYRCTIHPGDGLIYRGTELSHWREPMQIDRQAQVFLHYVDQRGPYRDRVYDSRPGLGFPAASKEQNHE